MKKWWDNGGKWWENDGQMEKSSETCCDECFSDEMIIPALDDVRQHEETLEASGEVLSMI